MLRTAGRQPFSWISSVLAFFLMSAAPAAAPGDVATFSASYSVRYGVLRGEMTLALERLDSSYSYQTVLRPRGFASWLRRGEIRETSALVTAGNEVRPLDYRNVDSIAKPTRLARYVFDQPPGYVTGEYKSQTVNVPMRPGGHNRISVQIAIMRALQSGILPTEFSVFDRGRWRDFKVEVIPDQLARTPSGDFETVEVRYAYKDKKKSWSLHCAVALDYIPVMIVYSENGKVKSRAVLTDYQIGE